MTHFLRFLFILIFLSNCTYGPFSQNTALDNYFNQLIQEKEIPGMSIAIIKNGALDYSNSFGIQAADSRTPVDNETIFEAASLSKPVFAYAVIKWAEAGKFDLDKPLYEYLEYEDLKHDERYKKITARMVLSHTSGLPNWRNNKLEFRSDPGEKFGYSGEGFGYLMLVFEKITGQKTEDFMKAVVLDPLGMKNSSYTWEKRFNENYAAPHDDLGFAGNKRRPKTAHTAYSLQTTAEDYAKIILALLNNKGLKKETIAGMLTQQVAVKKDHKKVGWGLGWGLQKTDRGNSFWHWGDNGTFRCFIMANTNTKDGFVYFTNSNYGLSILSDVHDKVFNEKSPAAVWLDYRTEPAPRAQLAKSILSDGFEKAIIPYLNNKKEFQDTILLNAWKMNNVGYKIMNYGKYEDAKKVFMLNIKAFPKNSNTYDSYAEACLKNGEQELAKKYYQIAFEKNKENKIAASIVQQLSENNSGNTTFTFTDYPYAKHVALAGSFNNWNSLSLPFVRKNGAWVCTIDLEPGTYEYKFIVDGVWTPDPENREIINNDGNINSVLKVE
ncbi:MAG: serine hydrolase [Bacteroidota bacterium]